MVIISNPCFLANLPRSGTRAMVPSVRMISQMAPAGARPAARARSTAASVWPVRTSTPPERARNGNTWPGRARSSGRVCGSTAARMVAARSGAEMPVDVLALASMPTHMAVPVRDEFCCTCNGMSSVSRRSGVIARQMRPRPCVAMKLMASGVTSSAAIVRSPSFSRSSSSTTMIILPARIAAMASSTVANGTRRAGVVDPLAMRMVRVMSGSFPATGRARRTCRPCRTRGSRWSLAARAAASWPSRCAE